MPSTDTSASWDPNSQPAKKQQQQCKTPGPARSQTTCKQQTNNQPNKRAVTPVHARKANSKSTSHHQASNKEHLTSQRLAHRHIANTSRTPALNASAHPRPNCLVGSLPPPPLDIASRRVWNEPITRASCSPLRGIVVPRIDSDNRIYHESISNDCGEAHAPRHVRRLRTR